MDYLRGVLGMAILLGVAFLFSNGRRLIKWRLVIIGVALQVILGIIILKVPQAKAVFEKISSGFVKLLSFSDEGASFIFGDLAVDTDQYGFIFAFKVLPIVIFFSTLTAGLYYLGVLQKIVYAFAWVMARTMRLSGAESLSAAGNVFLGQTEAPLLVKPYIKKMTDSELLCLMTGGMATVSGAVFATYVAFLGGDSTAEQTRFAAYLLSASIMNAPAAIVVAKILFPEQSGKTSNTSLNISSADIGVNLVDALARGASDGLKLALNIGAMLLAFISVVAAVNYFLLEVVGANLGLNELIRTSTDETFNGFSLEYILGQVFRVFAFIMGVDWSDSLVVGSLLGKKTVINEFVAYLDLSKLKADLKIDGKALLISTYALCGFANFSSIAIQIGGIGGLAPTRQSDLSRLGLRALLGGSLASMLTATLAGMIA
jgi:concentrative nucleoside transporter, CNT family